MQHFYVRKQRPETSICIKEAVYCPKYILSDISLDAFASKTQFILFVFCTSKSDSSFDKLEMVVMAKGIARFDTVTVLEPL